MNRRHHAEVRRALGLALVALLTGAWLTPLGHVHVHARAEARRAPSCIRASGTGCAAADERASAPAGAHDPEHCGICQLALAPLALNAPSLPALARGFAPEHAPVTYRTPAVQAGLRLPFACGPPA